MPDRTETQRRITSRITVEDRGHTSPCWVSNRGTNEGGYTRIWHDRTTRATHRVAYEAFVGPIPAGLQIDHLCRVRACCRPDHLEPVTCRENLLRGDTVNARAAATTHCPRGHAYTAANTYVSPSGRRHCRTCEKARRRARKRNGG